MSILLMWITREDYTQIQFDAITWFSTEGEGVKGKEEGVKGKGEGPTLSRGWGPFDGVRPSRVNLRASSNYKLVRWGNGERRGLSPCPLPLSLFPYSSSGRGPASIPLTLA